MFEANFGKEEYLSVKWEISKISNGTRSEDGKAAWENLMSVQDTCRKQGVNFFDYIKDIFSGKRAMTKLAHLISQNASLKPTFY